MAAARPDWSPALGGRNPRLDGLRGVAILSVLLYHVTFYQLARSPWDHAVTTVTSMGWTGVDLFFVLSGFLITGILLRSKGAPGYFRSFYARRFLRIFPLYYAVLALFLIVLPMLTEQAAGFWKAGSDLESFWYWTYLSNVHVALTGRYHHHFLHIAWTLAIEEHFYLIWPWVVHRASRAQLVRICLGVVVGALALRVALKAAGADPLVLYTFTPCRLDALAIGSLVALLADSPPGEAWLRRWSRPLGAAAGLAFVGGVVLLRLFPGAHLGGALAGALDGPEGGALAYMSHPALQTVGYTLAALAFAALLVRTLVAPGGSPLARALSWAPLCRIGRYSYAIYLLHVFGADLARNVFEPMESQQPFLVAQPLFWALALGVTYALAAASWHGLEVHFLRLRRLFPYGAGPGGAAPGAEHARARAGGSEARS